MDTVSILTMRKVPILPILLIIFPIFLQFLYHDFMQIRQFYLVKSQLSHGLIRPCTPTRAMILYSLLQ